VGDKKLVLATKRKLGAKLMSRRALGNNEDYELSI
jgi:hypothetical protein